MFVVLKSCCLLFIIYCLRSKNDDDVLIKLLVMELWPHIPQFGPIMLSGPDNVSPSDYRRPDECPASISFVSANIFILDVLILINQIIC
jgi:hypothetical protein